MVARLSTVRKASTINMAKVALMAPPRQKAGSSAYILFSSPSMDESTPPTLARP
jgi:hypothetical protein